jgi:hypothetical protein
VAVAGLDLRGAITQKSPPWSLAVVAHTWQALDPEQAALELARALDRPGLKASEALTGRAGAFAAAQNDALPVDPAATSGAAGPLPSLARPGRRLGRTRRPAGHRPRRRVEAPVRLQSRLTLALLAMAWLPLGISVWVLTQRTEDAFQDTFAERRLAIEAAVREGLARDRARHRRGAGPDGPGQRARGGAAGAAGA